MSGKGGGTNTVTSQSAPPPEVLAQYQNLIGQSNTAAANPLQQYNGSIVAGFTPDQQSAFSTIANSQGVAQPYLSDASNLLNQSTGSLWNGVQQYSPQALQQYMNPYQQDVTNATMANINETNAQQQQQVVGNAISSGAWGGDRSAIAQSELARQQALASNQTLANLNSQNFQQGQQEFNTQQQTGLSANAQQAGLAAQGAFGFMNLGNTAQTTALTGANAQLQSGALQQQLAQEQLNVPYEQFQQQQAYPFQNLSWLSGISTGLGSGQGGTSSTTSPAAGLTSQLAGLGTAGIGLYGATHNRGGRVSGFSPYRNGGGIPRFAPGGLTQYPQINGDIPDMSISYLPGAPSLTGGRGVSIPPMDSSGSASKTTSNGNQPPDAASLLSMYNTGKGLGKIYNSATAGPSMFPMDTSATSMARIAYPDMLPLGQEAVTNGGMFSLANGAGDAAASAALPSLDTAGLANLLPAAVPDLTSAFAAPAAFDAAASATAAEAATAAAASTAPEWLAALALLKRGGAVKEYDGGGLTDQIDPLSYIFNADAESPTGQRPITIPSAPAVASDSDVSRVGAPSSDSGSSFDPSSVTNAAPINKPNPWLALAHAGFAMAAGNSPQPLQNIGAGAVAGLDDYAKQKEEAAKESEQKGSLEARAQQLADEAKRWRETLGNTENYQTSELAQKDRELQATNKYRDAELALKGRQKWVIDPNTGMPMDTYTGEMKNPYAGKAAPVDATGNPTSNDPQDYFGGMSAAQITNYRNTVKKNQPKDLQAQQGALSSLVDQNIKINDLVNQIPLASHGDLHKLSDFVDRNQIPVFSDPARGAATVSAAYDSLGNVLDNLKSTFGGTGRVLQSEFATMKQELNAAANMSPEQKAAVVGKIQKRLAQVTQDQMQYTDDVSSGLAYLPSNIYKSPAEKRLQSMAKASLNPPDPTPALPKTVPPGSKWSPSRKQFRGPDGALYDANGNPL